MKSDKIDRHPSKVHYILYKGCSPSDLIAKKFMKFESIQDGEGCIGLADSGKSYKYLTSGVS